MNYLEIFFIGLVLAVDATVYSFSYGLILREKRFLSALQLALTVGFYQGAMPLIGYMAGNAVHSTIAIWDHWIVLAVFLWLGFSIIRGAWKKGDERDSPQETPLSFAALMFIGIATSIDALAVGACMALGDIGGTDLSPAGIVLAAVCIGFITFCCSEAAFHLARPFHHLPTRWLETASGLLLIALGVQKVITDVAV